MTDTNKKRNYPTKRAPRRIDTKYDPKFARQLMSGIRRKKGYTIAELCSKWKISYSTYKNWVANYTEFREAHEVSKIHEEAYWLELHRKKASGENPDADAGCIKIRMVDMESEEWTHRNVTSSNDEPIRTININILPSPTVKQAIPFIEGNVVNTEVQELENVRSSNKPD